MSGCSIQIGWLGFEHPVQTGTTHVSQALASQGCRLMPIPELWHGGRAVKAVWFVAQGSKPQIAQLAYSRFLGSPAIRCHEAKQDNANSNDLNYRELVKRDACIQNPAGRK